LSKLADPLADRHAAQPENIPLIAGHIPEIVADAEMPAIALTRKLEPFEFSIMILRIEHHKIVSITATWIPAIDEARRKHLVFGEGLLKRLEYRTRLIFEGLLEFLLGPRASLESPLSAEERHGIDVREDLLEGNVRDDSVPPERW